MAESNRQTPSSPSSPAASAPAPLALDGVSVRVGAKALLDDIALALLPGEFLAVLGPNGAGKSTLLAAMDATLRPTTGAVRLFGRDPWAASEGERSALRARIGVVPQRADFNPLIPLTARDVVAIGRLRGHAFRSRLAPEDHRLIDATLERLGIADLARRVYRSLSGGEQQKVQLARALAQQPEILLLDEPTSGLDLVWQEQLADLIAHLSETTALPIVMTTHILGHLPSCCRRAALMREGRLLFVGAVEEALSAERLSRLYDCRVEVIERGGRRHCLGAGTFERPETRETVPETAPVAHRVGTPATKDDAP